MSAHPILFLDIDGVLNTPESCARHRSNEVFLPSAVAALLEIHTRTGCDVVISSSWRMDDQHHRIRPVFEKNGLAKLIPSIIGATPVLPTELGATRQDEIEAWLEKSERISFPFAILDDDASQFAGFFRARLVLVDDNVGLTLEDARKCLRLLNATLVPYHLNRAQKAQDFRRKSAEGLGR